MQEVSMSVLPLVRQTRSLSVGHMQNYRFEGTILESSLTNWKPSRQLRYF